jgi:hypothetical protein
MTGFFFLLSIIHVYSEKRSINDVRETDDQFKKIEFFLMQF